MDAQRILDLIDEEVERQNLDAQVHWHQERPGRVQIVLILDEKPPTLGVHVTDVMKLGDRVGG